MPGPNPQNQRPNNSGSGGNGSGNSGQRQDQSNGSGQGQGGKNPQRPPQGFFSRNILAWVFVAGAALLLIAWSSAFQTQMQEVTWQDFVNHAKTGDFQDEVIVQSDRVWGELKANVQGVDRRTTASAKQRIYASIQPLAIEHYLKGLDDVGQKYRSQPDNTILWQILISWGPFILFMILIWFFVLRSFRAAGGGPGMLGSFGRSRHRTMNKEHSNVTLADVAGIDEAKEEIAEVIEFLKNPKKFQHLGGRVPRGVLLVGEPGCGKTLLAKAVAGEADVPFFSISGSDFVEMFVGVGASRVRDLFKQAKDSSPCIIFLDEIDAVGRRRTYDPHGGSQETSQTLNAILVEMDGFDTSDQVIVMAATNRADVLDPALVRPGRFDRQITVPLPDLRGRVEILKVHSRRIKLSPNVEMEKLARGTPMFSGADLAALINEAAIIATLTGKDFVEQDDLEEARDKVKWGRARKSRKIEEEERAATAYHEAGHAVLQSILPHADPLHKVTIIPRGMALGATIPLPEKDRYGYALRYLTATMRVMCGGRIAEQRKTSDVSSGASMDIRQATAMARHMILEWGMSKELGFVHYASGDRDSFFPDKEYSDLTARLIDQEVKRLIDEAYADAQRLLDENWTRVVAIAEALLRYETLSKDEVDRLMRGEQLTKATVSDLLKAEGEKVRTPAVTRPVSPSLNDPDAGAMPQPA